MYEHLLSVNSYKLSVLSTFRVLGSHMFMLTSCFFRFYVVIWSGLSIPLRGTDRQLMSIHIE